ncbi:B30.2/SPRY domain-containing protein [Aphelenchoides besseyi]|nr:B30.2/SPRY domain-containing protein [Aphelenchoides besseyi]KAI6212035.1 B30.2/SPRY domain-containing protein [Aphelenchoides besseyi]
MDDNVPLEATVDVDQSDQLTQRATESRLTSAETVDVARLPPDSRWLWSRELIKGKVTSREALIQQDTVVFHPDYSYGTAAVLGELELTPETVAYWEIRIPNVSGTSMMFGIGTANAKLLSPISFENLIGNEDRQSYGLSHHGNVHFAGEHRSYCPPLSLTTTATVGVLFDGPKKELSFFINGQNMGVGFGNIDLSRTYHPMVSSTSQKSWFTVINQRRRICGVTSLKVIALEQIADFVLRFCNSNRPPLGLPNKLADQLEEKLQTLRATSIPSQTSISSPRKRPHKSENNEQQKMHELTSKFLKLLPTIASEYRTNVAWVEYMEKRQHQQ